MLRVVCISDCSEWLCGGWLCGSMSSCCSHLKRITNSWCHWKPAALILQTSGKTSAQWRTKKISWSRELIDLNARCESLHSSILCCSDTIVRFNNFTMCQLSHLDLWVRWKNAVSWQAAFIIFFRSGTVLISLLILLLLLFFFLLGATSLKKPLGSVISHAIGVKFGRIILQVDKESYFWYDAVIKDGSNDVISRREVLPPGKCTQSACVQQFLICNAFVPVLLTTRLNHKVYLLV